MNKSELTSALKDELEISSQEASTTVEEFFNSITNTLYENDRVEIRGLFSFNVKEYNSYIGRNPKTSEKVLVPKKRLPFFKCSKELKELINLKL